jgi:maltose O-acetyltransferase
MNRDDFCNLFINWIPITRFRKLIYLFLQMNIDPSAHIMRNCHFASLRNLQIGKRSIIRHDCFIDARGCISIGEDVNISSFSKLITAKHIVDDLDFAGVESPITIDDRVWIASDATILQDVTIGEGAVVAAGSVVTKNVEPFTIVAGVPAKIIGKRNCNINYKLRSKPSRFL